jgi:sulfopyruvate decarboxylase TPP-binding subunit
MTILPAGAVASGGASASGICRVLAEGGVTHVVTVPDFVQFSIHERLAAGVDGIRQILACSEDQALTTAAGLYVGGARPVLLVQNQGLYKVMNTLRAVCVDARVPVVVMVGQFGREEKNLEVSSRQSSRNAVRLLEPALEVFDIPYWPLDREQDLPNVGLAIASAEQRRGAAALIVGRCTTWA